MFTIGDGEPAKTTATVADLCSEFARWGLTCSDCVVGVGGGLVTDVAGFAAGLGVPPRESPWCTARPPCSDRSTPPSAARRGSTSPRARTSSARLLAAEGCDLRHRERWPRCRHGSGAAVSASSPKYHWLGGGRLDELDLPERVAACVAIKADVVSDEREGGRAGAVELRPHARPLARDRRSPRPPPRRGRRHRTGVCRRAGPRSGSHRRRRGSPSTDGSSRTTTCRSRFPAGLDTDELVEVMGREQEGAGEGLTFVLDGPTGVEVSSPASTPRRCGRRWPASVGRPVPRGELTRDRPDPPFHPAVVGTEPEPARRAPTRGLRDRHPRRGRHHGGRSPPPSRPASRSSTCSPTPRSSSSKRCTVHAGPRRDHRQRRSGHPLRLGAARRPGRVRRPGGGTAPVQPVQARAVAAHVGGLAGGRRGHPGCGWTGVPPGGRCCPRTPGPR